MVPLSAEIITEQVIIDERAAVRRSLRLGVSAHSSGDVAMALILNISETGLLIETVAELAVGETLRVDIPEASASTIRVVWTEGLLAGCEFVDPVSTGAVSAAQLKSPIEPSAAESAIEPAAPEARAGDADFPAEGDDRDPGEIFLQAAIVIIPTLISLLALIIFLAAVLPL